MIHDNFKFTYTERKIEKRLNSSLPLNLLHCDHNPHYKLEALFLLSKILLHLNQHNTARKIKQSKKKNNDVNPLMKYILNINAIRNLLKKIFKD